MFSPNSCLALPYQNSRFNSMVYSRRIPSCTQDFAMRRSIIREALHQRHAQKRLTPRKPITGGQGIRHQRTPLRRNSPSEDSPSLDLAPGIGTLPKNVYTVSVPSACGSVSVRILSRPEDRPICVRLMMFGPTWNKPPAGGTKADFGFLSYINNSHPIQNQC